MTIVRNDSIVEQDQSERDEKAAKECCARDIPLIYKALRDQGGLFRDLTDDVFYLNGFYAAQAYERARHDEASKHLKYLRDIVNAAAEVEKIYWDYEKSMRPQIMALKEKLDKLKGRDRE